MMFGIYELIHANVNNKTLGTNWQYGATHIAEKIPTKTL